MTSTRGSVRHSRRTRDGRPPAPLLLHPAKLPGTVPPPLDGDWAPADTRLDQPQLYPLPDGHGPEDVAFDAAGRLVSGDQDGRLWRWPAGGEPGQTPSLLASTGGRPLGIELDPTDGSLVVCDAYRGLLRVTADAAVSVLATEAGGTPINLCNNASIARDGTVYFTDSSHRFPLWAWKRDLVEHQPNGRVLAYHPGTGRTDVVATGLYFPNGVGLSPDESALLVAETTTHRLIRVALPSGEVSELTDLPAYPDNLSTVGDGTYWVALPSPRLAIEERLLPHPMVRRLIVFLPDRLQPGPAQYGLVAQVDGTGRVLRTLHGPTGVYSVVTGVREHDGALWLGSLTEPAVARIPL
ncbi:MAG: SMP-30/gluconolactonase/LRE family protein [Sporichthyaceae bacterium]|nr:SMP-30/gluconolactonase/LRE family protein [Sporichthyaceae bacterium]